MPASLTELQADLLSWGEAERRDLPWRRTRDPWAVLVSELMLQQTQVQRAAPRWRAFLVRFPTPAACAAASVGEVVRAWAGLGYNRRAVNLHRAASSVVERHGGVMPDELGALLALPGVGPYTARAVLVFAHERDIGLVDTNAGRFIARALAGRAVPLREAQALADAGRCRPETGGPGGRRFSISERPCAPGSHPAAASVRSGRTAPGLLPVARSPIRSPGPGGSAVASRASPARTARVVGDSSTRCAARRLRPPRNRWHWHAAGRATRHAPSASPTASSPTAGRARAGSPAPALRP